MFVKRLSGHTLFRVHVSWEGLKPDLAQWLESNPEQQTGFTDRERPAPISTGLKGGPAKSESCVLIKIVGLGLLLNSLTTWIGIAVQGVASIRVILETLW